MSSKQSHGADETKFEVQGQQSRPNLKILERGEVQRSKPDPKTSHQFSAKQKATEEQMVSSSTSQNLGDKLKLEAQQGK